MRIHRTLPALVFALSATAQQDPPVFRTDTEMVEIPAVVRDRRGADVEGLRLEDFRVREDGKPRTITQFSVERRNGSIPIPDQYVVYVFDDLHLSFSDLASARTSFERHLEGTELGGRRVAVVSTSGSVTLPFTADRAALLEAARRIRPEATTYNGNECPSVTHYVADQMENKGDRGALASVLVQIGRCMGPMPRALAEQIARTEAQRILRIEDGKGKATVALLNREIDRASRMPGDRHLVLLSSGFHVAAQRENLTATFERAARNRVTISAVNAHGVDTTANIQIVRGVRSSGDVLAAAADLTGGVYIANSNDTEQGLRRVAEPPRVVYNLGFVPESDRPANEYHRLDVRVVGRSGVTVQARRGYYARHPTGEQEALHSALFS